MSTPLDLKLDPEKVQETPMVDLAFMILKAANTPYYYRDLMNEVAKLRGMTDEEIQEAIAQLYTEINIDGRFACVGTNLWGLKRWYPLDKSEDPIASSKRPRIINDDDDDLDDEDYVEEDDDSYSVDDEDDVDYDAESEDEDEIFSDDDDSDVEDDSMLDDDDLDDEDLEGDDENNDEDDLDQDEEENDK
ncbi:DNA-directed RNA polymerase subunit delta [Paenibacillus caui]|uniref:DNA-directed RNA polymerase subunit delta n=1 Tax=Paenibacillus caui TaxID=2873927 RepID=UPI001CA9A6E7